MKKIFQNKIVQKNYPMCFHFSNSEECGSPKAKQSNKLSHAYGSKLLEDEEDDEEAI